MSESVGAPQGHTNVDGTLTRSSLRGDATRVIKAQIIGGQLQTGRLYSIGEIATSLGTSPTPVREALLQLANQGLIEMVRNRGFRVVELTDDELDHLVEIRTLLEVPAVERLAAMTPLPDLADVRQQCDAIEDAAAAGDLTRFLAVDRDIHLSLIAKLGNPRLTDLVGELRDQSRLYGLNRILNTPQLMASAEEHRGILEAVEAHDAERAAHLLRQHLGHIRTDWSAAS